MKTTLSIVGSHGWQGKGILAMDKNCFAWLKGIEIGPKVVDP